MTHFNAYASGMIALEAKARGLAEELFLGLKELAIEVIAYNNDEKSEGKKDLKAEFSKSLTDLECTHKGALIKLNGNENATLASEIKGFKNRRSELNRGIKEGVCPSKYESFTAYRKAIDKVTGGNSDGRSSPPSNSGASTGSSSKGGGASDKAVKLQSVTNDKLSAAVQDQLKLVAKHLSKLSEADQLKVLKNCDGAIHKLANVGGRFSNVKSATS